MTLHGVTRNSDGSLGQLIVSLSAAQHIRETKSKYFHFQEHPVPQREQCTEKSSHCLATESEAFSRFVIWLLENSWRFFLIGLWWACAEWFGECRIMNTSALYAEGGYFYHSVSLLMEGEAGDKPWNVTGWKWPWNIIWPSLLSEWDPAWDYGAPCPNPVSGCVYWKVFLSYIGMKTLLVQFTPIALCLFPVSPVDREPPSSVLVLQCWDGIHRDKGPSCFCLFSQARICSPQIIFVSLPWTCSICPIFLELWGPE